MEESLGENGGTGGTGGSGGTTSSESSTASTTSTTSTIPLASCAWTIEFQPVAPGTYLLDDAAPLGDGGLAVAVRTYTGNAGSFEMRRFDADGAPSAPPLVIGEVKAFPNQASLVGLDDGAAFVFVASDATSWIPYVSWLQGGTPSQNIIADGGYPQHLLRNENSVSTLLYSAEALLVPPEVVRLAPDGSAIAKTPLSDWLATSLSARAWIPMSSGGSLLIGSTDTEECWDCPLHAFAVRLDPSGEQVSGPHAVFSDETFGLVTQGTHVGIAPRANGAWVAWAADHDDSEDARLIHTVALDDLGKPVSKAIAHTLPDDPSWSVAALTLAALEDGATAIAWLESQDNASRLRFALLGDDGKLFGEPLDVDVLTFFHGNQLRLEPAPGGAFVTLSGVRDGDAGIFNYRLRCPRN